MSAYSYRQGGTTYRLHHLQPRGHRLGLRVLRPAVDATVRRPAMVETSAHLRRDHLRPVCHADRCGTRPVPRLLDSSRTDEQAREHFQRVTRALGLKEKKR